MTNAAAPQELQPKTMGAISPQIGGWFLLLCVVGAVLIGRFLATRAAPPAVAREARYRVDINQAEEAELLNLPEIGPSLAKRILQRRDELREFRNIEDLNSVPGIGPQTLKQLAPYLLFSSSTDSRESSVVERPERGIPESGASENGELVTDRFYMATQPEQAMGRQDE